MSENRYSPLDRLLLSVDRLLRLLPGGPTPASHNPADELPEAAGLTAAERQKAAALMRVNHAGELAAQGLYLGQSLAARSPQTLSRLQAAGNEEAAHVDWCRARLRALGGRRSLLDPAWFGGALAIGTLAGLAGTTGALASSPKPNARSRRTWTGTCGACRRAISAVARCWNRCAATRSATARTHAGPVAASCRRPCAA